MLFNSLRFLFLFFPIVYFVYWKLQKKNHRYVWLTIAGYVFYGSWNYKFCALMALSTLVSYIAGLGMLRWPDGKIRKVCLVLPITVDLVLLGFFKYFNFVLGSIASLAVSFKHPIDVNPIHIILPVGISFYTFHTITYIVDSYRRTIKPTRNVFEFACYVCLFPQLVAGPIVRFRQIESDLENIDHADRLRSINRGWSFFIIGMIKKVLLADSIAAIINPALTDYSSLSTVNTWLCILGYTYQLYFDFSGYSDMAVGLGYMFGIRLPQNFNSPYKSVDISDFWRRWHISLSTCLRDYLYIPLGGSRDGGWKTYQNLLITMLFGGLWHGANWTFVFWGGYHGVLLGLNRLYKERIRRLHVGSSRALTFFAVVLGWLFFRATDFHMASVMLNHMFTYHPGPALTAWQGLAMLLVIACAIAHFAQNTFELEHDWGKITSGVLAVGYVACLAIIAGGSVSPFLYFQF